MSSKLSKEGREHVPRDGPPHEAAHAACVCSSQREPCQPGAHAHWPATHVPFSVQPPLQLETLQLAPP
jgi:hypothetical protein